MGQIALSLPQTGLPNSTEDVKVTNDLTLIQNVINGGLDANNIAASLGQAASVNVSGQTVKGATNIAASESRSNAAYGTLTTPDQVTGIVLPTNGLIAVWYQATWQESVALAARAAIFIGANQLKLSLENIANPTLQEASTQNTGNAAIATPLGTTITGLSGFGIGTTSYLGDVTTGQIVGTAATSAGGGTSGLGGPLYVFAAAGTYTVSVQFKASSGSVTASNRKLWVQALSFA